MFCKKCPACGKESYSAASRGEWICPYCKADLSKEPIQKKENENKSMKIRVYQDMKIFNSL